MPARRARISRTPRTPGTQSRAFCFGGPKTMASQVSKRTLGAGIPLAAHGRVPKMRAAFTEPMYATLGHGLPSGAWCTCEPNCDGMRVIAEASSRQVRLMTRNGKDKQAQFPEVVRALRSLASCAGVSVVLD